MVDSDDEVLTRAARWFARLRSPDGAGDRAAFAAWRDADPRHAAAFARLEADWRRTRVLSESQKRGAFELRPVWWKRLHFDRPNVFASAFAAVLAMILLGIWTVAARDASTASQIAQSSQIGEIRTIVLADGSRATLDTDSAVTEAFTSRERLVRLDRGRVRFDVRHDERRPFVVIAGATRVIDKGTVFDVQLRDRQIDVVLFSGSVEISSRATMIAAKPAALTLSAGQRASVHGGRAPLVVVEPGPLQTAWVSGMLDFEDAPLADILADVNRYNARHILLGDPRLGSVRTTGAFRATEPADVAQNLAALFGLRVETDAHKNWVLLPK